MYVSALPSRKKGTNPHSLSKYSMVGKKKCYFTVENPDKYYLNREIKDSEEHSVDPKHLWFDMSTSPPETPRSSLNMTKTTRKIPVERHPIKY